jgi:hypothetical protein
LTAEEEVHPLPSVDESAPPAQTYSRRRVNDGNDLFHCRGRGRAPS